MENQKLSRKARIDLPFYGAFVCTMASFLLHFLSFSSPYWLESYPETKSHFLRMGLWQVCFNEFIHQNDPNGNEWHGCYWIMNWHMWHKGLFQWINPYWFIGLQVVTGLAFICHCICAICMLFYFLLIGNRIAEVATTLTCEIAAAVLLFVSVTLFGIKSEDREWMPRPDHNHLSWSYAFAVLSCFSSVIAAIFLYIVYTTDKEMEEQNYLLSNPQPDQPMWNDPRMTMASAGPGGFNNEGAYAPEFAPLSPQSLGPGVTPAYSWGGPGAGWAPGMAAGSATGGSRDNFRV